MKYDLFSGKSERLYKTKGNIVNVKISRKKQLILIQVTSGGQTELVLMNKQGKDFITKPLTLMSWRRLGIRMTRIK